MAHLTFQNELDILNDLIDFKAYVRYNEALFVEHCGALKPECTVSELVWGWCRNPCFANALIHNLMQTIPDYPKVLGSGNRNVCSKLIASDFDGAMKMLCKKDGTAPVLAYSKETTNPNSVTMFSGDNEDILLQEMYATEDDGEFWNGLVIPNEEWVNEVDKITVSVYGANEDLANEDLLLWQKTFASQKQIIRRVYTRNDMVMFQPFTHPLTLMNLDVTIVTKILYKDNVMARMVGANSQSAAVQLFSIGSNGFCDWLQQAKFETKLCKKSMVRINMPKATISFK